MEGFEGVRVQIPNFPGECWALKLFFNHLKLTVMLIYMHKVSLEAIESKKLRILTIYSSIVGLVVKENYLPRGKVEKSFLV